MKKVTAYAPVPDMTVRYVRVTAGDVVAYAPDITPGVKYVKVTAGSDDS